MKVIIAENSGFCFGVKRAIENALKENKAYTLGPLIHNREVVRELEDKGIKAIDNLDGIDEGTLIIRTHGVSKKIIDSAKAKGLNVIDLTCPFVKKVQDMAIKAEKEGYKVIVVGDRNHPEVKGIVGNISNYDIIEKPEEANKEYDKAWVVVQTTQPEENFKNIVERLNIGSKELKVSNTICNATSSRQKKAKELAGKVDIMIVVGGMNSANTNKLERICSEIVETKHIEIDKDLKIEWFIGKGVVGITAGTSTAENTILKVKEKIEKMTWKKN